MRRLRIAARFVAAACTLVAGGLMVAGPVTRWASVNADPKVFAAALHETVPQIRYAIRESTGDVTWVQGGRHGDVAWLMATVVVLVGLMVLRRATLPRAAVVAGLSLVIGWLTWANAPDLPALRDEAVGIAAPWAFAVQRDADVLVPAYEVRQGPGVVVGEIGALIGVLSGVAIAGAAAVAPIEGEDWIPWARFHPNRPRDEEA